MYLNLDLLYNTYNYLFPLFYYQYYSDLYEIYSPMTKKSVYKDSLDDISYFDYITDNLALDYSITETEFNMSGIKFIRCKPFKLDKLSLEYLKSNKRIKPTLEVIN